MMLLWILRRQLILEIEPNNSTIAKRVKESSVVPGDILASTELKTEPILTRGIHKGLDIFVTIPILTCCTKKNK